MGSLFARGSKLYAKVKAVDGAWKQLATGFDVGREREAEEWMTKLEAKVAAERTLVNVDAEASAPLTVRRWARRWSRDRATLGKNAKAELAQVEQHVLPFIGDMLLADVKTPIAIDLFRRVRSEPSRATGRALSPRTVHHLYAVFSLMMRDAALAGHVEHAIARLDERHLGRKVDRDPEWRATAMFSRDEVQTLISTHKIPWDRRVAYAIELLAGTRPGEAAALRWRHYDTDKRPLGELLVARAYSATFRGEKGTKTDAVKHVPVHPTLAAILAEWKLGGWAEMMGRPPQPDDLIVPLPPADAHARTRKNRSAEPFRDDSYARRRWLEEDLPALGWRHRRHYDTRATFITLALEDGASREVIETRVTHTKRSRSAFDMYNRGLQWAATCAEVAKLRIARVTDPSDNVIELRAAASAQGNERGRNRADLGASLVQSKKSRAMSTGSAIDSRVTYEPQVLLGATPDQSSREVGDRALPPSGTGCTKPHQGVVLPDEGAASDVIDVALDAVRAAWRAEPARARRELLRLLAELEVEP